MDTNNAKRVVYKRKKDGKWAWRLVVGGDIIATDGGQGYENKKECREMADAIISGYYSEAERFTNDE